MWKLIRAWIRFFKWKGDHLDRLLGDYFTGNKGKLNRKENKMKKLVLSLIILSLMAVPAIAETTQSGNYPAGTMGGSSPHSVALREHTHDYGATVDTNTQRLKFGAGATADIIVWDNKDSIIDEAFIRPSHDFINDETRVFVGARIELFRLYQ